MSMFGREERLPYTAELNGRRGRGAQELIAIDLDGARPREHGPEQYAPPERRAEVGSLAKLAEALKDRIADINLNFRSVTFAEMVDYATELHAELRDLEKVDPIAIATALDRVARKNDGAPS